MKSEKLLSLVALIHEVSEQNYRKDLQITDINWLLDSRDVPTIQFEITHSLEFNLTSFKEAFDPESYPTLNEENFTYRSGEQVSYIIYKDAETSDQIVSRITSEVEDHITKVLHKVIPTVYVTESEPKVQPYTKPDRFFIYIEQEFQTDHLVTLLEQVNYMNAISELEDQLSSILNVEEFEIDSIELDYKRSMHSSKKREQVTNPNINDIYYSTYVSFAFSIK